VKKRATVKDVHMAVEVCILNLHIAGEGQPWHPDVGHGAGRCICFQYY
jgi:hypothetical protein